MDFWLWTERITWLIIIIVNTKKVLDIFFPSIVMWLFRSMLKNHPSIQTNLADGDENGEDSLSSLASLLEKGAQAFLNPPRSKNTNNIDPNRRNVRARNQKNVKH